MSDTIRIPPKYFQHTGKERTAVVTKLIEDKYANRVVRNVGLCICVYDFVNIGNSYIYPGDGAAHTDVQFNVVVFKPFPGEVLEGRVSQITRHYVRISLGFFDNVYIAAASLPQPSEFKEGIAGVSAHWAWKYFDSEQAQEDPDQEAGEAAAAAAAEADEGYFIELNNQVRFKVKSIDFGPFREDQDMERELDRLSLEQDKTDEVLKRIQEVAPMVVMGGMGENYLGLFDWWDNEDEQEQEAEGSDEQLEAVDAADE